MKKLLKKFAGFITVFALLLSFMPTVVFANDNITDLKLDGAAIILSQTSEGEKQYQVGDEDPITYTGTIRFGKDGSGESPIVVQSGEHDIIILSTSMDFATSKEALSPLEIKSGAIANVFMDEGCELRAGDGKAGIQVNEGATLNLTKYDEVNFGNFYVYGGLGGAGIGGGNDGNAGTINISDITLELIVGGAGAAAIGGGNGGDGGNITISGNTKLSKVQGGENGAGIGGGNGGDGGNITISGNTLLSKVQGGENGAGIGGGNGGDGGNITISGNTTLSKVQAGENGAGIGGGNGGDSGIINILNGTINTIADSHAIDDDYTNDDSVGVGGAGIGGGDGGDCNIITISGGKITAIGGAGSPGIGGGGGSVGGHGGTINILGGIVSAIGGNHNTIPATGIGAGGGKHTGDVTISGGYVTTTIAESAPAGYGIKSETFSTTYTKSDGTEVIGNAFIDTLSTKGVILSGEEIFIYDRSDRASWSGVIFEGDSGFIYGSPTISTEVQIQTGKTLTIEDDKTLTIGVDGTLKNFGTIINDGTLVGAGSLLGVGTFQTNVLKGEYITGVNSSYVYKGTDITVNSSINDPMFLGVPFDVIGWSDTIQKYDVGTWNTSSVDGVGSYRVIFTKVDQTAVTKEFTVVPASTATDITAFTIPNQVSPSIIDVNNHTIEITMPFGTDKTTLKPTITLSDGAAIDPTSGTAQDFTNAVSYTVMAEDSMTTQVWTVIVTNEPVEIINGTNQTVQQGRSFSVTSNDDFTNFIRLEITLQGQTAPIVLLSEPNTSNENASVVSGSIIATLNSTYTSTLPVGIHTVTIHSTGGSASTQFEITKTPTSAPTPSDPAISPLTGVYSKQTGDNSNTPLITALLLFSALCLTTLFLTRKNHSVKQK